MADDVTTTDLGGTVVQDMAENKPIDRPAAVVTVETTTPTAPVMGPSVSIDREYLAQVIGKQCGLAPDQAAQLANACPPEVAIPLEAAARGGDLATVHTLLAEITPK